MLNEQLDIEAIKARQDTFRELFEDEEYPWPVKILMDDIAALIAGIEWLREELRGVSDKNAQDTEEFIGMEIALLKAEATVQLRDKMKE